MDVKPQLYQKPGMPAEIIARMAGKRVFVMLKDGHEIEGTLISFDENSNAEVKVGEIVQFIQGESINSLSFR